MSRKEDVQQAIDELRTLIEANLANDRARSCMLTRLDEVELWHIRTSVQ